jgi:hypothetical protein
MERTSISLSPYNMKRIKDFIKKQKSFLGPRINMSIFIEEAINISWEEITQKFIDKGSNVEKGRQDA